MNRGTQRRSGAGALELIEEAVRLLRCAPVSVLGAYYVGALPWMIGFLYFWTDMSRGVTASDRCASAALNLGLLFLWLKTWQTVFAGRLRAQITGRPAPRLTARGFLRIALIQTILQPSGLFLLATCLFVVVPFGWVYAFYQNVAVLGAEEGATTKVVARRALKQAGLWPGQNHLMLGLMFLFSLVVLLNVASGMLAIPSLLKMLLGIETSFTRSPLSFLNTTFMATVCGITWLCIDPVLKTIYLLRCFYGESLHTGEDLKAELNLPANLTRATTLAALITFVLASSTVARATDPGAGSPAASASSGAASQNTPPPAAALDRAIEQVLQRPEFNWRLPREKRIEDESHRGALARFVDGMIETFRRWGRAAERAAKAVIRWIGEAIDWLQKNVFGRDRTVSTNTGGGGGWIGLLKALIFILLALLVAAVAVLVFKSWRRRETREAVQSTPVGSIPDLTDENVTAGQLPEDEWLRLARELMERGELRLAVRAFYLASLAHLAQREMISVAKFKSNRDYEAELRRRARALPDLQSAFGENGTIFDCVWYGLHEVTQDAIGRFVINLEKIRAC